MKAWAAATAPAACGHITPKEKQQGEGTEGEETERVGRSREQGRARCRVRRAAAARGE
jgi:hypothetical protein